MLAASIDVQAAGQWISSSTPNFRLYTAQSPESGDRILQALEQARYFFLKTGLFTSDSAAPLTIFISHAGDGLSSGRVCGYYQRGRKTDYIVLQDRSPGCEQTPIHEYTHFALEHAGIKLPQWLKEGLADLYSSLEPRGSETLIGRALPGRLFVLRTRPPVDWDVLLSIEPDSPYYRQSRDTPAFYAQSWALTHMLAIDSDYSARFEIFVRSLANGRSSLDSFRSVYGKDLDQVNADLKEYLRQTNLPMRAFDVDINRYSVRVVHSAATQEEIDIAIADLLASNPYTQSEAEAKLLELSERYPLNPEPEELLGYITLREHRAEEARLHFARAIQRSKGAYNHDPNP